MDFKKWNYKTYKYRSPLLGIKGDEFVQEKMVTLFYKPDCDIDFVLHEVARDLAINMDSCKLEMDSVSFIELMDKLTQEILTPYEVYVFCPLVNVVELDETQIVLDGVQLRLLYEMCCEWPLRVRQMADTAQSYVGRLMTQKAKGHPVISTWNEHVIGRSAIKWAREYTIREKSKMQRGAFFEAKLAEAVPVADMNAILTPESAAWAAEFADDIDTTAEDQPVA